MCTSHKVFSPNLFSLSLGATYVVAVPWLPPWHISPFIHGRIAAAFYHNIYRMDVTSYLTQGNRTLAVRLCLCDYSHCLRIDVTSETGKFKNCVKEQQLLSCPYAVLSVVA